MVWENMVTPVRALVRALVHLALQMAKAIVLAKLPRQTYEAILLQDHNILQYTSQTMWM